VANPLPLIGLPTDDFVRVGTLAMTPEDAANPASNAATDNPAVVAKSTNNGTTFTITTPSFVPAYLFIVNSSAESGTFNGNAFTCPGLDLEGQRLHTAVDLRGLGLSAGTSWTLALTRASGILWVGRIALFDAVFELNVKYGWQLGATRPGEVRIPTRGGVILKHSQALRTRWAEGVVDLVEDEAMLAAFDLGAHGDYFPSMLVPNETTVATEGGMWVHQTLPYAKAYPNYDVRETKLRFEELVNGPVNG
jgi:hypothetical protein